MEYTLHITRGFYGEDVLSTFGRFPTIAEAQTAADAILNNKQNHYGYPVLRVEIVPVKKWNIHYSPQVADLLP